MIHIGDCLEVMKTLDAESIDAIVTDPPYGLSFMGKDWDHGIPGETFWSEALRVAKPGTHLLAFGGTRTFHRLTVAIEDAGWEIRDCIMWVYGSGFPKSHDVSKAIDREAGEQRGRQTVRSKSVSTCYAQDEWTRLNAGTVLDSEPITPEAAQWQGWGTALKPAWEPIIVARKPLAGTVAQNVQAYGTGAVNVDGCRIGTDSTRRPLGKPINGGSYGSNRSKRLSLDVIGGSDAGRWPANLIHDGSDEVVGLFPETTSQGHTPKSRGRGGLGCNGHKGQPVVDESWHDRGSAARFFYCAKASKADRDSGLDGWATQNASVGDRRPSGSMSQRIHADEGRPDTIARNHHPTVKPNDLMRYLCRLVAPPGGTVLDPFCGSGSTGKAAVMEGFRFIGIELNPEYAAIAEARIQAERDKTALLECIQ